MRPEPDHSARRAAILEARPEVKRLFGPSLATAWLGAAVVALQFGLAAVLAHQPWWLACLAAFCVGAFADHCLNCIMHECTHNLVFENQTANKAFALFANLPCLVPSAVGFRHYHLLHHHHFGVRGMDSDIPTGWEVRMVERRSLRKLLWILFLPVTYALIHPLHVRARLPRDIWLGLNVATCFVAWALVAWFLGWPAVLYLLLSTYLAVGPHPAGAHIVQEHIAFDGGNGMASYYGPLNLISVNLGYHLEHHDIPAIAGWRLPELRRIAPEFYATHFHHRSRTEGLLRFVFDGRIGLDSRPIRELSARSVNIGSPA